MKRLVVLSPLLLVSALGSAPGTGQPSTPAAVRFMDVTEALGIDFRHVASPTSQKYLPETMGSGVALFDSTGFPADLP